MYILLGILCDYNSLQKKRCTNVLYATSHGEMDGIYLKIMSCNNEKKSQYRTIANLQESEAPIKGSHASGTVLY